MTEAEQTVRLAEFQALREEVSRRTSSQHALLTLNLTLVTAVVGFVVTKKADKELLLLLPVGSSTLALLWLDHNRYIVHLAAYIRDQLWAEWHPSWETHISHLRSSGERDRRSSLGWIALVGLFCAGSLAALVLAWPGADGTPGIWILWGLGLVMTVFSALAYQESRRGWELHDQAAPPLSADGAAPHEPPDSSGRRPNAG